MNNPFDERYICSDEEIQEMLECELEQYKAEIGKLTPYERKCMREWVSGGNSVYENPYEFSKENGCPMDYITARRIYASLDAEERFKRNNNANHDIDYSTRRRRRTAVKYILSQLSDIRDAEQKSIDRMPENFQCSESYEAGELAIEVLDEVLELLAQTY